MLAPNKSGREPPHSKTLARNSSGFRHTRSVLECASPLALSHRSPIRIRLKFIHHRNAIRLEPVNRLHHRRRCSAFKPCRRAPRILASHRHQPVLHRVLMNIVEPRQIRPLMREFGVPEVEPDPPARLFIKFVYPFGSFDVQHAQHRAQTGGVVGIGG